MGPVGVVAVSTASFAPNDMPSAAQLLEAVREFLESDVLTNTEGRVNFHVRVAVNVLGMVIRELEIGPSLAAAHAERLRLLGFGSEADLARAIRDGSLDDRLDEVRESVRAAVADKLAVSHPGYAES
jgi:hypothetical protein